MRVALLVLASLVYVAGCDRNSAEDKNSNVATNAQQRNDVTTLEDTDSRSQNDDPEISKNYLAATADSEQETSKAPADNDTKPPPEKFAKPLSVYQYQRTFHAKEFLEELALGEKVYVSFGGESSTISKLAPKELQEKCRKKIEDDGWTEASHQSMDLADGAKREEFQFEKNGHAVSITTSGPDESGASLSVKFLGNIDMRKLPRADSFEIDENASFTYVGYTTDDEIEASMAFCKQRMVENGWKEFTCVSEPSCLPHLQAPNQVVAFCQAGFTCYITVGRYPGFKDGKSVVNYIATGILPVDLLVTDDAKDLKLDVLLGKATYKSKRSTTEIRKAITSHFERLGFPHVEGTGEKTFIDIYNSGEGEQILTDITPLKDGTTSVQLIRQFENPESVR